LFAFAFIAHLSVLGISSCKPTNVRPSEENFASHQPQQRESSGHDDDNGG